VWLGDVPLKVGYHGPFKICSDPKLMVNKTFVEGTSGGLVGDLNA
jgi:hypothetical protein